jgi:hypothetical protein
MRILRSSFSIMRGLDSEFRELQSQCQGLQSEVRALQSESDRLRSELGSRDQRISKLEQEIAGFNQILDIDFLVRRISPTRKHAWHVAAPKSGSTWLTMSLSNLLGWTDNTLAINGWDRREQVVDFRNMLNNRSLDLFSLHQHCPFSNTEKAFIDKFRVEVILQGRDMLDTIVSCYDHLRSISTCQSWAYFDEAFASLDSQQQMDAVVDLVVPWYLKFYCSWFAARSRGEVRFLWITYEEMLRDPSAVLRRVIDYLGESRTDGQIADALRDAPKRGSVVLGQPPGGAMKFNVGKAGRGQAMLSAKQKDRVRQLRGYYPHIDLSPVGL